MAWWALKPLFASTCWHVTQVAFQTNKKSQLLNLPGLALCDYFSNHLSLSKKKKKAEWKPHLLSPPPPLANHSWPLLPSCCGWLFMCFGFGDFWWVPTQRPSVHLPNLRLRWKILIWDLSTHGLKASQSTLHQWVRSAHSHFLQQTGARAHAPTHTHWHTLGRPNQSEGSRVGPPRSGWESSWNRSPSQGTKFFAFCFWRTFLILCLQQFSFFSCLFVFFKLTSHSYWKSNLGSFSAQLECGMAELVRIRKKRLQIPITR